MEQVSVQRLAAYFAQLRVGSDSRWIYCLLRILGPVMSTRGGRWSGRFMSSAVG